MIGLLVDAVLDAAVTMAAGFFKSAERERDEWMADPKVTVYAPKIVRHHRPWPGQGGGRNWDGPWPFEPWPGGRR